MKSLTTLQAGLFGRHCLLFEACQCSGVLFGPIILGSGYAAATDEYQVGVTRHVIPLTHL